MAIHIFSAFRSIDKSCSKLHSAILFTSLSCICINLSRFSITYEFSYSIARLRHSIILFGLINTHTLYLIQAVLIIVAFQQSRCLMIDVTWIFVFNHVEFVHHVVNNSMVLLFFLKPFFRYGIAPTVLRRLVCIIISSKFAQNLTFIRKISEAMDHAVFQCALQEIYISFMALARALILCRIIVWRGGLSSIIPTESSTVGFFLSSF